MLVYSLPPQIIAVNTVDSATISPSWALDRITDLKVDKQGVTLQLMTGEKIKSTILTPPGWVQIQPLDGVLCKESCTGAAPSAILINQGDRPANGTAFLTIMTNSRNIYKLKIRYGAPAKRTLKIGG